MAAVPVASQTPSPVIESFEKRQPVYAPVETYGPVLETLAASAVGALKERASGADDSFDSLLCATLKALKGENPGTFTSLLQSCTSLTDSSSTGRSRTLKQRSVVDHEEDLAAAVEALNSGSGEAILGRSETDLTKNRDPRIQNLVETRHDEISPASLAPY